MNSDVKRIELIHENIKKVKKEIERLQVIRGSIDSKIEEKEKEIENLRAIRRRIDPKMEEKGKKLKKLINENERLQRSYPGEYFRLNRC